MPITKATPNVISPISTTNLADSIVLRDASGNFSAGTITATLSGNATTATTCTGNSATATALQTARTIALTGSVTGSASFDGSANISITTTGSGGSIGSAKAWVNFNGTTSPGTIRASYNVSSVTRTATGNFTINFNVAMQDTNYSVVCSGGDAGSGAGTIYSVPNTASPSTSSFQIEATNYTDTSVNRAFNSVIVFGN
jgi:hypothetical protein